MARIPKAKEFKGYSKAKEYADKKNSKARKYFYRVKAKPKGIYGYEVRARRK